MPFRQPSSATIRQPNFRSKSCTFPVESVLPAESGGGHLQIDVTNGYLLTTSANETPQDQQFMTYERQDDASWLVRGTVTLTATLSALISGTVTLQEPYGGSMGIPIQIDPVLFIDTDVLRFDDTKPHETSSVMLAIRQQGAVTPIKLTLDPPHQFTLADTKRALITTSTLSTTPTFEGGNVIVGYKPNRVGRHTAKLVITTPYATKIVTLLGQTGGLLSRLPRLDHSTTKRRKSPVSNRGVWLSMLLIMGVGGLLWAGYATRSQNKAAADVVSSAPDSASTEPTAFVADKPKVTVAPPPTALPPDLEPVQSTGTPSSSQRMRTEPHFTVIAGVFSSRANAVRQMLLLRKAGYSDAFVVAPAGPKGFYKVAALGSSDRTEALAKMGAVRQLIKSNPWLLTN